MDCPVTIIPCVRTSDLLRKKLDIAEAQQFFWTDSKVVLGWKGYGLLFTCLCSHAVHIELLDNMTTNAFIIALRALIALRGNNRHEFLEAVKEMDQESLRQLGCEFVMNPPSACHMGGAWERQIRTRQTGPQPLTPNPILTMKSSIVLPPPGDFVKEDLYLRKRSRKIEHLANEFWSRNAQVNDIVIVQDDNAPQNEWNLPRSLKCILVKMDKFKVRGSVFVKKASGRPRKSSKLQDHCLKSIQLRDWGTTNAVLAQEWQQAGVSASARKSRLRWGRVGMNSFSCGVPFKAARRSLLHESAEEKGWRRGGGEKRREEGGGGGGRRGGGV
ncbi:hypothetical protein FQN60_013128, partial [Etheostoma spectabile]